ncbi:MAG TPA: outer membrane lipoprotein-sorting protein [Sediminispirochaeta sp.]|nr:outer membrane lipoprotein-sorting protein [Sediminispirochaeta sp.]
MILGRKHIGLILVQMLAWVLIPAGAEERPPVQEVVTAIDRLYRHESARTLMEMEIRTTHWTRSLRMEAWSEGMEKTFIRILEPRKERGMGTLKIGNEMWNYLPKTNRVMKIPPLDDDEQLDGLGFSEQRPGQRVHLHRGLRLRVYTPRRCRGGEALSELHS